MIAIVLLMVRARYLRAIAVGLLAAFILAVAAGAPAYLSLADRAMINSEVAHAPVDQLTVEAQTSLDLRNGRNTQFEDKEPSLLSAPWWDTTFAANTDIYLTPPGTRHAASGTQSLLLYRQDYCGHIVLLSGRCPVSTREVVVAPDAAAQMHAGPGSSLSVFSLTSNADGFKATGAPLTVSVVGVYRPRDPAEPYWGLDSHFDASAGTVAPVLTERGTLNALPAASTERQSVDALLRPAALTPSMFPRLRAAIIGTHPTEADNVAQSTGTPDLLNTIDRDRETLRELVPLTAVPLVALGCFVLFLVAAYAVAQRRPEIGVVKLRGTSGPTRWWLGVGETLIPCSAGAVLGYLAAAPLARALAGVTLAGTHGAIAATASLGVASVALAGVVVAVVTAHRRILAEPLVEVLRHVPTRTGTWRSVTAETLLVVLGAAAVVQVHTQTGPLTGITLLAPALVVAAIAILIGRFLPPIAARLGDACLGVRSARRRRARLGLGLGALQLARRPGAQRLLVIQIVAIGLGGYAVIAASVAAQTRTDEVRSALGASRVLAVRAATTATLQAAVLKADPSGRYAMAAVQVAPGVGTDLPLLAVDATRLANVAAWPDDAGLTAASAAQALRPALPVQSVVTATEIALALSTDNLDPATPLRIRILLAPTDGSAAITAEMGDLRLGDHTYTAAVPYCAAGCRIAAITMDQPQSVPFAVTVTIEAVRTLAPTEADVHVNLDDATRWRAVVTSAASEPTTLVATSGGLSASLTVKVPGNVIDVAPINVPYPLPIVATSVVPRPDLRGIGGQAQSMHVVALAHDLPRLATRGALVDLGYADAVADPGSVLPTPEVWLAPATPDAVVRALSAAGLTIVGDTRASSQTGYLGEQGPAVGARANLAFGAGGPLLAVACMVIMAGIDRRHRAAEFGMLRTQGLAMATVRRASLAGQLGLIPTATVIGACAALVAWIATGNRIPMLTSGVPTVLALPGWLVVVAPAAAIAALLAAAAFATVADTVHLTRRSNG